MAIMYRRIQGILKWCPRQELQAVFDWLYAEYWEKQDEHGGLHGFESPSTYVLQMTPYVNSSDTRRARIRNDGFEFRV
ncbi:hypothetical protein ColTof4_01721 [Colletotrichum tofieldiae]|nr:hypothetical protein ColTof3_09997 [Colletotrichum tofieldiae]GKT69298.1 hypothetical protein ColTof4_01721 [Colletotrichum tofieldiae]GKT96404.1 hypothetical protein Ct61P_14254 [Colletotrichum tofieldiae]